MSKAYNKYNVRRSGLITPWGVGAIIPYPNDESLMIAGIDNWYGTDISEQQLQEFEIVEERLTKRLHIEKLMFPPDFREKDRDFPVMKIPAVRFPLWHYCPVCGNMEKIGSSGDVVRCKGEKRCNKETYCMKLKTQPKKSLPQLVPERFIAICDNGHIEDFPIAEWVHAKTKHEYNRETCKLRRSTGGNSSSLSGIRYTCTCGASYTMTGAFNLGALDSIDYYCDGAMPWLGDAHETCGGSLRVVQRGASNVWFANIVSSIYIPQTKNGHNDDTKSCIEKGIKKFKSSFLNGILDIETIETFVKKFSEIYEELDNKIALDAIISELTPPSKIEFATEDEIFREAEYKKLIQTIGNDMDEFYCINMLSDKYKELSFLKSISLVHKLRETRAFTGFTRLNPDGESAPISVNRKIDWLPAITNSGEGIMFEFDDEKLSKWANLPAVLERVARIEKNISSSKQPIAKLNPKFILIHTFAHVVISELAAECGYANASLREKIYCTQSISAGLKMSGVLIYTASGDSEGSLGGLVRKGIPGKIERIITNAINKARWCSADPVCIQSNGQGQEGCNLAACHNCALLPETSCESKNKLLDRGLLIGTIDDQTLGYFNL